MSFETYNVYFSGTVMKGQDPLEVRNKIGSLFNLDGSRLERLFSGQPVAIKKGVDMDQAVKYRIAFREAGALVEIRPSGNSQPQANAISEPRQASETQQSLTLSPAKNYDLSDCTVPVPPQEIPDISRLTLDKPGVILDETDSTEPLEIDTDAFELDMPGAILDPTAPRLAAEIDTSALVLNPANQGSLEEYQQTVEPIPLPDIDHLEFTELNEKPKGKAIFSTSED